MVDGCDVSSTDAPVIRGFIPWSSPMISSTVPGLSIETSSAKDVPPTQQILVMSSSGDLMSWILLKVLCLDIHYLGFDHVWYPLQKLRVWYPLGNLWGTVLFLIRHSTSRLLRQGSPYLDYEQLVLNSNKEGMDFLRKGQYKQGRLGSPGMLSDGFRMGFCWWIVLVVTVSAMLKLKRMVDGELMMVSRS